MRPRKLLEQSPIGKRIAENGDKIWEDVIAEDFTALRKVGLDHVAFDEVLNALQRK